MNTTHVVGIDPGLVHSGVVRMVFTARTRELLVEHEAVAGPDAGAASAWINHSLGHWYPDPAVFIEGYRPRSNLAHDQKMTEAVARFKAATAGTVVPNMGVKQVVKRDLLVLMGLWSFGTVTHHQDLRSAARIAVLGMLKNPVLNRVVYDVVDDHLNGRTWTVRV